MSKIHFSVALKSTAPRAPGGAAIYTSREISKRLGTRARVNVVGAINGHAFRNSMFPTGTGTHYMVVNRQIRDAIGVGVGDRVKVVMEVDTAPRVVEVSADVRKALAKSKKARAAFQKLPPSHQREYLEYVEEAKRPETRARRIEKTIAQLAGLAEKP